MDAKELRQKSTEELRRTVMELRAEIREMRFKAHTRSLRAVRALREKRRDLARALSVTNEPKTK
jgi:ribosomal protein L29